MGIARSAVAARAGLLGALAVAGLFALAVGLAQPAVAGKLVNSTTFGSLAIEGADAVAYFTERRPVKGDSRYEFAWMGATWRFASAANRDAFAAAPDRYAPQYGGYCAWAIANGYTASIDPEAWTVHDGKLYLNYSKSVRAQWAEDIPGNVRKGDSNWPGIRAKLAE
ncbi:MAG: YHS domain-containing protein [Proteobacteria bacterium]|nr:YHS domain-containing protein [Pseudomonadota bacterium]